MKNYTSLAKREYKDDEKKVIKNSFCYCILTLFYIFDISPKSGAYICKLLIFNYIEIEKIANPHISKRFAVLNNSKCLKVGLILDRQYQKTEILIYFLGFS